MTVCEDSLGSNEKAKYASFVDFFDKDGTYKLAKPLEGAYKAATPNQFQKDFYRNRS